MLNDLADLTADEIPLRLARAVFEANLLAQSAILYGIPVQMDVVEREIRGVKFPQFILRVGDIGVPAIDSTGSGLRPSPPETGV